MPEDHDDADRPDGPRATEAPETAAGRGAVTYRGAPMVARRAGGAHALRVATIHEDSGRADREPGTGYGNGDTAGDHTESTAYHDELLTSTRVAIVAPRHRIERRAPILWTIEGIWSWVIIVGLQIGWYYYGDDVMGFWNWVALVLTVPFAFMSIVVAPWWRYVVARWDISDTAVCARSGWWTTHLRIAPLSRLQTVYTTRNLFERWFGLATVHASTASAHGSVQIRGLAKADADRVAEHLLAIADLDSGDAT